MGMQIIKDIVVTDLRRVKIILRKDREKYESYSYCIETLLNRLKELDPKFKKEMNAISEEETEKIRKDADF